MARKVLKTETRTVSGQIEMPNGGTDYGREPPYEGHVTGPGWAGTTTVGAVANSCYASFYSSGPDSGSYEYAVGAEIQVGAATAYLDYSDTLPLHFGYNYGRGLFGDTITGSFSFSCPSELVCYTYGEEDIDVPEDGYPSYGGVKIVGEFPSNYGILVWEPVADSEVTGTVTLGSKSASLSAPSSTASFSSSITYGITLGQCVAIGGDHTPWGNITASINLDGYPVGAGSASAYYEFSTESTTACGGSIGAGFATAYMDTRSEGIPSAEIGGIQVGGLLSPTQTATLELSAYAMDQPHPHACEWKVLDRYIGVIPPDPGDEYGTIIDPPSPVWTDYVGQSVTADISLDRAALRVAAYNKSVGPKHRTGGNPAQGTINGVFNTFDHYENEQGRIMAYIIPPPGEDSTDWRVPLRGKAFDAMTIGHSSSREIDIGDGNPPDGDGSVFYPLGSAQSLESGGFLRVQGSATALEINGGKRWNLSGSDVTIDLCFPDSGYTDVAYDLQNTRFPLNADGRSIIDTPYWGVSTMFNAFALGGAITALHLNEGAAGVQLNFLAPFLPWQEEVPPDEIESGGDTYNVDHYCVRLGVGDVDGRQGFEVMHVRRTDNYAPGRLWVSDYSHLSIATAAAYIETIPGWSATPSEDDGGEPAWYMGPGFTCTSGTWTPTFGRSLGTVKAQPLYDSMYWEGDPGDVFATGSGTFSLVGRKVFRGSTYGAVRIDTTVYNSDTDSGSETSDATNDKRYGLVGPTLSDPNDWGKVWADPAHKVTIGLTPRLIERVAFGVAISAKLLAYAVGRSWRHVRAMDRSGLAVDYMSNSRPFDWALGSALDSADWATIAYPTQGSDDSPLILYGLHGDTAILAKVIGEGESLIPQFDIGTADYGAHCFAPDGALYVFRLDGGTIYGRSYDVLLDPTEDEWTTTITSADDAPIQASTSVGSDGELRIHVQYFDGATVVFATSPDGKDFT